MTNYEYIKKLSRAEILNIMCNKMGCDDCPVQYRCWYGHRDCRDNLEEWLDEEQKND